MLRSLLFVIGLSVSAFGNLFSQAQDSLVLPMEDSLDVIDALIEPNWRCVMPMRTEDIFAYRGWANFFGFGAGYSAYLPSNQSKFGIFHGVSTEFVWVSSHARNYKRTPCNWRIYSRLAIMNSSKENTGGLISYLMGANFSLESKVRRKWMIPYMGFEIGGLKQKELGGGLQLSPILGVQLFANQHFSLQAQAAYTYSTRAFDQLSGWGAALTANFFLWGE